MSDLPIRALTAILLGVGVIGGVYYSEYTFILLLSIIVFISSLEYIKMSTYGAEISLPKRLNMLGATIASIPLIYYLVCRVSEAPFIFPLLILAGILGMMGLYTYLLVKNEMGDWRIYQAVSMALVYIGIPGLMLSWVSVKSGIYDWWMPMSLFLLIWSNDMMAYFTGRLFGKRPLYAAVSPKKTIEGFAGGLILTIVVALIISIYIHQLTPIQWVIYGFLISLSANIGDLFESLIKRRYGVKDSGTILPGHGGFLDRFDAFIFTIPVATLFLYLYWH
jgi:phosphatidate cytidylyltransferase